MVDYLHEVEGWEARYGMIWSLVYDCLSFNVTLCCVPLK